MGEPAKVFDRTANLEGTQIINYRVDPEEKWCVLIGIAPGSPERCASPSPPPQRLPPAPSLNPATPCLGHASPSPASRLYSPPQAAAGKGLHAAVLAGAEA